MSAFRARILCIRRTPTHVAAVRRITFQAVMQSKRDDEWGGATDPRSDLTSPPRSSPRSGMMKTGFRITTPRAQSRYVGQALATTGCCDGYEQQRDGTLAVRYSAKADRTMSPPTELDPANQCYFVSNYDRKASSSIQPWVTGILLVRQQTTRLFDVDARVETTEAHPDIYRLRLRTSSNRSNVIPCRAEYHMSQAPTRIIYGGDSEHHSWALGSIAIQGSAIYGVNDADQSDKDDEARNSSSRPVSASPQSSHGLAVDQGLRATPSFSLSTRQPNGLPPGSPGSWTPQTASEHPSAAPTKLTGTGRPEYTGLHFADGEGISLEAYKSWCGATRTTEG